MTLTLKKTSWKQALHQVESITDAKGKEIDPGIKDAVLALLAHGFDTTGSCAGHLNRW